MPRLKIPLKDDFHPNLYSPDHVTEPRVKRLLQNVPKKYIFHIDENNPTNNWFTILIDCMAIVPCLFDYVKQNGQLLTWNTELYPHNSITDNHEALAHYLEQNVVNPFSIVVDCSVSFHPGMNKWVIVQNLYQNHVDLITEYRLAYIPRLRSMEKITNITFTRKLEYDNDFKLP